MHTLVFLLTVMVQFPIFSPFYLLVRIITSMPVFRHLTARFIGMGLQPQHIKYL